MNVQIGENSLAFFRAVNNSNKEITTMSVFNVTPLQAGKYFNKIECFCFEEQVLSAREEVNMPVSFFIDPAIKDDKFINDLKEITLSYTMYIR
jgi:cytochrome c oxidase assembly protein subunit 11